MLRNWTRNRNSSRERGFTLPEVLVSLFSVAIILILAGETLFATRRASQRQQFQVDARQTARAAIDYVSFMLRGASDLNSTASDPAMILMWFWSGVAGTSAVKPCPGTSGCYRTSYDNFGALSADSSLGTIADANTDVITFSVLDNVQKISPVRWVDITGNSTTAGNGNMAWTPPSGCPPTGSGDSEAFTYFKTVTGQIGNGGSRLLVLADGSKNFVFYQISSYVSGTCSNSALCPSVNTGSNPCIITNSNAGASATINPPGKQVTLTPPVTLLAGARYYCLRVRNGWLEQKDGVLDPTVDNPGTSFVRVLPNVEDLQLAYVFRDGTIWNNAAGASTFADAQFRLPVQVGSGGTLTAQDIANVVAIRVTITARSATPYPIEAGRFTWLDAENHAGGTKTADAFYRYQTSSLILLRNRLTGS